MQFIFRIPSRFMTVFFGFDPCVTIYYEILFRKSEPKVLRVFLFYDDAKMIFVIFSKFNLLRLKQVIKRNKPK